MRHFFLINVSYYKKTLIMEHREEKTYISHLIAKYLRKDIEPKEQNELDRWRSRSSHNERMFRKYTDGTFFTTMQKLYTPGEEQKAWKQVRNRTIANITPPHNKRRVLINWTAAACILLIAGLATFFSHSDGKSEQQQTYTLAQVQPRKSQATLFMAQSAEKTSAEQTYTTLNEDNCPAPIQIHTEELFGVQSMPEISQREVCRVVVPRGGEYCLAFNEHSEVFLNSESDLQIDPEFSNNQRRVAFKGEAFFNITRLPDNKPFSIATAMGTVQVVGTSFNLRCHDDEHMLQLTLESGKVNFTTPTGKQVELLPGKQINYYPQTDSLIIASVNPERFSSWRKGIYAFEQTSLEQIMKDLSRCYNVPIEFESEELKAITFTGEVRCYDSFESVIQLFELTKMVQFCPKTDKSIVIKRE